MLCVFFVIFLSQNQIIIDFIAKACYNYRYRKCRWRITMSITSARKVTGSPSPTRRTERSYMLGIQGEAFVENIDTTNSVSINDDSSQRRNDSEQSFTPGEQEQEKRSLSSAAPAYVVSAIEALAASGVYDNIEHVSGASTSHKVGVYDNNQSIIKGEREERNGHPYLKHFYEKNEIVEEVDEFV